MAYHPWRNLRELHDWECRFDTLPPGVLGLTDFLTRTITISRGLTQVQRRSTLAHELQHVARGTCSPHVLHLEEAEVDQAAARALIPLDALLSAVVWARDVHELAEECWVDVSTMKTRLAHLHPAESAAVREAARRVE